MIYIVKKLNQNSVEYKYTSPTLYFDFPYEIKEVDFDNIIYSYLKNEIVILSSGDLIYENKYLNYINTYALGKILWGCGINNNELVDYDISFINKATLSGARDYGIGDNIYVPDVSCMHEAFDKQYIIKYEKVLYFEEKDPLPNMNLPKMSNIMPQTIEEALEFIGSGEIVITNSFYGAYWGTLLGRKIIVLEDLKIKFLSFKYFPTICLDKKNVDQYYILCKSYPQALEDSRNINKEYFNKVKNIINILLDIPEKREKLKNKLLKYKNVNKINPFDPVYIKEEINSFIKDIDFSNENIFVLFNEINFDEYLYSSFRFELNEMLFYLNSNDIKYLFSVENIQRAYMAIKKARGNVLIVGLDVGFSAIKIAEKSNVNSVLVVENDINLINIFNDIYKNKKALNKISFVVNKNIKDIVNDYDFIYLENSFIKTNNEDFLELIQNKNVYFAGKEYSALLSLYNNPEEEVDDDTLAFLAKWCFTKVYTNLVIGDIFMPNLQKNMKEKYNEL